MKALSLLRRGESAADTDMAADSGLLDFHSPTIALSVTPALPGTRGTAVMVASLVGACFAAAALIPIDKVVTAQGKIVTQRATTVVQPLETAIVRSVDVREGDRVREGQVLARLDPTFAAADVGALRAQVASLRVEVERLQAEANDTDFKPTDTSPAAVVEAARFMQRKAERAAKNENYELKLSSLENQVRRAMSDMQGYAERLRIASDVEQRRIELQRLQVGSQLNRLAATDNRVEIQRNVDSASAQAAQAARDLQALKAERDAYNENWKAQVSQDLTEQSRKLSDAEENLKKAMLRRQLVELRADQDSTVLQVAKVSPGSVMQSGDQLMTLVPKDAPLEAEVNVSGADVGYVQPGDTVTIKLDTLPYAQYGTVSGTVRVVSPDSFQPNQDDTRRPAAQPRTPQSGPAYFRSYLAIGETKLHDTPAGFRLTPGMPVTADVKVGKHTLVSYLLGRVMPVFGSGMREP